ncbi:hypothetical protein N9M66_06405, partial [Litoreibacter sp.]|nr:hypothetical protein [Litoreibacter sp.]
HGRSRRLWPPVPVATTGRNGPIIMSFTRGFPVAELEKRVQKAQRIELFLTKPNAALVLAIEPGYDFVPGKMMLHEESVVIRADGAELKTRRAPAEIPIL